MTKMNRFTRLLGTIVAAAMLLSSLGSGSAPNSGSVALAASVLVQPLAEIIVDGIIDAAYGAPVASDPAGDGNGNANLDLLDLYIAEDANSLYFAFSVNGNIGSPNWGKYAIYLDTTNDSAGATSDAWTRNVIVNDPHKPEYGIYTWVDATPYGPEDTQLVHWTDSGWDWGNVKQVTAGAIGAGATSVIEWQVSKVDLGSPEEIWVEVWDTGGGTGDNAQDTINDPADDWNATDWTTQAVLANSTYYNVDPGLPQPGFDNNIWWDGLEHDSRGDMYRIPFGAVTPGTPITLRFRTYAGDVTSVKVRLWDTFLNGQTILPMEQVAVIPGDPYDYDIWQLEMTAPDHLGVLYYRFIIQDGTDTDYYEDDPLYDGSVGQPYDESADASWQIDVYDPGVSTPEWFKNGIVYQIFPERFRNGDIDNDVDPGEFFYDEPGGTLTIETWNTIVPDPRVPGPYEGSYSKLFYGGDLQGIIDQLDYLQNLGVTVLYLNPIFESPSNHKYDTTNYMLVDDDFGGNPAFNDLITQLELRGMHLVLDGVFNHTSSDSEYFDRYGKYGTTGACEDVNSPFRSWYYFTPADPPGTGVCAGDTNYTSWWGFDSLPKLNTTDSDEVRNFIFRDVNPEVPVATYWYEQGADGWRLDVAGDVDPTFWQEWRPYVNAYSETLTIAEEWGDASRFILGDQLDSAMNYRFRNAIIGLLRDSDWVDTNSTILDLTPSQFDSVLHSMQEDYPTEAWYGMMNLVGSHDTNRVLIPLDEDGDPYDNDFTQAKSRQQVMALIQMTVPGAPTIYYGDEVGLVGYGDPETGGGGGVFYSDPYNRQPFPWPDEAGYGDLPEWRQQDQEMLAYYQALGEVRNTSIAIKSGSFDTLLTNDDLGIYTYGRKLGDEAAVVVANLGPLQTVLVDVTGYLPDGTTLTGELNGASYTVTGGQITLTNLDPMSGEILTVDDGQDLTPPEAPTDLTAVELNGAVALNWTSVTGAETYNIYRSYVYGGGYELIASGVVLLSYQDEPLPNGVQYYYVVTALDADGNESVRSNEVEAMPHVLIDWAGDLAPAMITHTIGITPTEVITAQVHIEGYTNPPGQAEGVTAQVGFGSVECPREQWQWTDMVYLGDSDSNDIYQGHLIPEAQGEYKFLARFSTTAGRDWTYAYVPDNIEGELIVIASDDQTPPLTPLNLRLTDWSTAHIALEWDPLAGDPTLYAYDIFRSEVSGTVGTKVGRVIAPATIFVDETVTAGMTYYYVVEAVDTSFNFSAPSNEVEATAESMMVEVTFQATVPEYTPPGATVYIVGNISQLCNWCNPQTVAMQYDGNNVWSITLLLPDGLPVEYKYTRGNWDINEWWGPIVSVHNRSMSVNYGTDGTQLVDDTVVLWRDPLVIEHTPLDGALNVDPEEPVTILVSRFLDPESIPGNVSLSGSPVPSYEMDWQYSTEITATLITITPTAPLNGGQFRVTLGTGLKGLASDNEGIALQQEYSFEFWVGMIKLFLPTIFR